MPEGSTQLTGRGGGPGPIVTARGHSPPPPAPDPRHGHHSLRLCTPPAKLCPILLLTSSGSVEAVPSEIMSTISYSD
jgi:hypothetical protein